MMQLVIPAACGEEQAVEHTFHAACNAAVVYGRRQNNPIGGNAFLNDFIDTVVPLDTAHRAIVQAVIARHTGMYFRAGLHHLKVNACAGEFLCHNIKALCRVAALPGASVDCQNLHF